MTAATLTLLVTAAAKATLLMLLAAGALLLARRASAAIRHWIAFLGLASVLLLPALPLVLPSLDVRVLPAAEPGAATDAPTNDGSTLAAVAAGIWLLGAAIQLARLARAHARAYRLRREALPLASWRHVAASVGRGLGLRTRVPVLAHADVSVPMVVGVLRPAVVVPQGAAEWTPGYRRAVLIHEMAHIRRGDGVTQLAAGLAAALYWFHPLAWWMARAMREEREFACDDLVLAQGARPSGYATLLLRLRGYMFERRAAPLGAVAFGLRAGLKERIESLLGHRSRRLLTPDHHFWLASALLLVLLPVAAIRPAHAEPEPARAAPSLTAKVEPAPPPPAARRTVKASPPVAPQPPILVTRRLVPGSDPNTLDTVVEKRASAWIGCFRVTVVVTARVRGGSGG